MADDAKTPLFRPSSEQASALADKGILSPETAALFGPPAEQVAPSTTENQLETERAQDAEEANDAVDTQSEDSPLQMEQIPTVEEASAQAGPGLQGRRLESELQPKPVTELSDEALQAGAEALMQNAAESKEIVDTAEDIVAENARVQEEAEKIKDAVDIKNRSEQTKEVIKSQIAEDRAIQEAAREEQEEAAADLSAAQANIETLDKEASVKYRSIKDIFDKGTTGDKILAGIGLFLGSFAPGGQNSFVRSFNTQISQQMEKEKLSMEESQAKHKRAIDLVQQKLKQMAASTDDQLKKTRIAQLNQQMEVEKQTIQQAQLQQQAERVLGNRLSSKKGLSREEVFALDPKVQKRAVFFSDGRARFTTDDQSAKRIREEILPSAKDAVRGMTRLQELSEQFAGGSLSPVARAEAQTIAQALKGALRLELFGPGVMTDNEQAIADKIIGNPTKLTSLNSLERKKLDTLMNKIKQGTKDKLRISGIELPESKNELMIKQLQKRNKGLTRQKAMSALIERGFWDKTEQPF